MNDHDRPIHGINGIEHLHLLTAADREAAAKEGVALTELAEHKARRRRGDFRAGMLKPLSVILLAD